MPDEDVSNAQLQEEIKRLQEEVAELRQSNQALLASQELAQTSYFQAPYNITFFDVPAQGMFRFVGGNPTSAKTAEAPKGTIKDEAVITAKTVQAILERLHTTISAGKPVEFEEHLVIGGRDIWTQAIYTPLGQTSEGLTRVMVTAIDYTQRKEQQNKEIAERELIIEQQTATLAELSTPLLTLSDQVVVLPLIGAIDSRRAQQVMDSLLTGIAETRASVVIMDITGVVVVDTQVANALLRAAQAVQLLGARVIITGIRPEIAQTMVGLGVDLAAITTRSTLQSAVSSLLGLTK